MKAEEGRYLSTFRTWDKVAPLYEEKFMHLDLYNESYDALCAGLDPSAEILEVGCGPGNITAYLRKQMPQARIVATDVSVNMVALAKKNVSDAEHRVLDARNLNEVNEHYDAVVCGFIVPYLDAFYLQKLLRDASALLKEKGRLYLSFIEGSAERSGFETGSSGDGTWVYYYREEEVKQMMKANALEPTRSFRIPYTKSNGTEDVHVVMLAERTA